MWFNEEIPESSIKHLTQLICTDTHTPPWARTISRFIIGESVNRGLWDFDGDTALSHVTNVHNAIGFEDSLLAQLCIVILGSKDTQFTTGEQLNAFIWGEMSISVVQELLDIKFKALFPQGFDSRIAYTYGSYGLLKQDEVKQLFYAIICGVDALNNLFKGMTITDVKVACNKPLRLILSWADKRNALDALLGVSEKRLVMETNDMVDEYRKSLPEELRYLSTSNVLRLYMYNTMKAGTHC